MVESWIPFSKEVFLDLKPFISLSIASVLILCGDEWCAEGVTFIAGLLGVKKQAAIYIQHSICLLMFYLPIAFSYSISCLVGGSLGKGSVSEAKQIMASAMRIMAACCFIAASFAFFLST